MITKYEFHKLSEIYPLADSKEFDLLRKSISESGQKYPIIIYDGMILDGRNRYRACQVLGIEPLTEVFEGTDEEAMKHSTELNSARRHTNKSQQAMTAARVVLVSREGEEKNITLSRAAEMFNVSAKYISRSINIIEKSEVIATNIFNGHLTIIQAEQNIAQMVTNEVTLTTNSIDIENSTPRYSEDEQYSFEERQEHQANINLKSREELIYLLEQCTKKVGINTQN